MHKQSIASLQRTIATTGASQQKSAGYLPSWVIWVCLGILVLATSWALFRPEFFRTHDYVHGARIAEMARALQDGQFPPRWSPNFGYGYGMPLFQFYAPLPFFVGALLYMAGVPLVVAVKATFLLPTIFMMLGTYLLARSVWNERIALLSAALVTLAPYRALTFYVRGAISEGWAMATYPWILLGIWMIFHKQQHGHIILILAVSALMLSHNISVLLFSGILVAWTYFLWVRSKNIIAVLTTFASGTIALGISAFYWVPAIVEKNATQIDTRILNEYFTYSHHFVHIRQLFTEFWGYGGSILGSDDGISFFLGYALLTSLAVAAIAILSHTKVQNFSLMYFKNFLSSHAAAIFFLVAGFVALAFSTRFSESIWQVFPLLEYAQFPWRWLGVAAFLLGLGVSGALASISRSEVRNGAILCLGLLTGISIGYFQPESYTSDPTQYYYADPSRIVKEMSAVLPDYLPLSFTIEGSDDLTLLPAITSADPAATVTRVDSATASSTYLVTSDTPAEIVLPHADYPDWKAQSIAQVYEIHRTDEGLVQLFVPSGTQTIELSRSKTTVQSTSDMISFVSALVLFGFVLRPFFEKVFLKRSYV
jgi:hypothetical protein